MTQLVVRRVIPIGRERVFDAWLDPARLARFMCPTTAKRATADVDPRVGGRFRIVMFHPEVDANGVVHTGEYLLIERPSSRSTSSSAERAQRWSSPTTGFRRRLSKPIVGVGPISLDCSARLPCNALMP